MPVTSVAELINLLAARRQASILHDRRTGMPYSWSSWLRARVSRGASLFANHEVSAQVAARPLPAPERVPAALPLWQAIIVMFWHGGDDPPPRDQRGLRWFSGFFSAALHLLFAALLLWVAMIRDNAPHDRAEDGERVQVQYIGEGTPDEEGGGTPQTSGQPAAAAAPASAGGVASSAEASRPSAPAMSAGAAPEPQVVREVAAAPPEAIAEQPLRVTETAQPTTTFVLTAPTVHTPSVGTPNVRVPEVQVRERTVETAMDRPTPVAQVRRPTEPPPQVRTPDVQVRERQVDVVVQPQVQMAQVRTRSSDVAVPSRDVAVRERSVEAAPSEAVAMASVRTDTSAVQVKSPTIAVRERQLPGVPDAVAAPGAASTGAQQAAPAAPAASAAAKGNGVGASSAAAPSPRPGTSTGAGPKPQDHSGGWAAPARGDDWSASRRQVDGGAGGQADKGRGLFNADGSVRLAGDGNPGQEHRRGAPGGDSDSWTRERIAESGTWLKRPPYEFTPTSLDKYWVPNESLLAEWVRKGIKSIEIPIPGTSSKISCVVSMLQFGGGCGLTNPNMQEQPAEARPPPDVPFKKELQEDNGSR